jgi:hypothetical protein
MPLDSTLKVVKYKNENKTEEETVASLKGLQGGTEDGLLLGDRIWDVHGLEDAGDDEVEWSRTPLAVGDLVVRGRDWRWGAEGGGGKGEVKRMGSWEKQDKKGVHVEWEDGSVGYYRYGVKGEGLHTYFDLKRVGVGDLSRKAIVFEGSAGYIDVLYGEENGGAEKRGDKEKKGWTKVAKGGLGKKIGTIPYCQKTDFTSDFTISAWFKCVEGGGELLGRKAMVKALGELCQFKVIVRGGNGDNPMDVQVIMGNAEMAVGFEKTLTFNNVYNGIAGKGVWCFFLLKVQGPEVEVIINTGQGYVGQSQVSMHGKGIFNGERIGAPFDSGIDIGDDFQGFVADVRGWNRNLEIGELLNVMRGNDVTGQIFRYNLEGGDWRNAVEDAGQPGGLVGAFGTEVVEGEEFNWGQNTGGGEKDTSWWGWTAEVKPVYCLGTPLADGLKDAFEKDTVSAAILGHDYALVKYANAVSVTKNIKTEEILRTRWEDISPLMEDLTRSVMLRELCQMDAKIMVEGKNVKVVQWRWKMVQTVNKLLNNCLGLVDLSKYEKVGTLAYEISKMRRLIFR